MEVDLDAQRGDSNVLFLGDLPKGASADITALYGKKARRAPPSPYQLGKCQLEDFAESTADIERYIRDFLNDPQYRAAASMPGCSGSSKARPSLSTLKERSVRNFSSVWCCREIANPQGI